MCRPVRKAAYGDGDNSDPLLDCGGTVGFTGSFVYLGPRIHYGMSGHHGAGARIKKASQAFCAFRRKTFALRGGDMYEETPTTENK